MSLLTPSTPAPDTTTADAIKALIRADLFKAAGELDSICRLLWRHSGNPTPQQVFDVFGTNASKLLDVKAAYVTFISTLATKNGETIDAYIAASDYTPTATFTANMDGTVTVT